MMCAGLFVLLFLTDGVSSDRVCSYQDVLDHLKLTRIKDFLTSTRPVKNYKQPTVVKVELILYAILAVVEKTQTFIPFIWTEMIWRNEYISWDPAEFCGIRKISLPKEMLWRPDLNIYEMTEKNQAPKSPYLFVSYEGSVSVEDDLKVVSTCKMDVYKFPFDTQSCNITFGSAIHTVNEIQVIPVHNSSRATQYSRRMMQTQGEWDFLNISVNQDNFTVDDEKFNRIIYTITMKRRPLLHVVNFLLPILFFLCLDLSSFLISDHRGEKLCFKVTVLLAVTVLQLILNEILPSMSNNTPLIATYCIVIFSLMMLSLLETVVVTYLMERDSRHKKKKADRDHSLSEGCEGKLDKKVQTRWTYCDCIYDMSGGDTPCELLPIADEGSKSTQTSESNVSLLIQEEEGKHGYWTLASRTINKVFFVFYVSTVSLFLVFIAIEWSSA